MSEVETEVETLKQELLVVSEKLEEKVHIEADLEASSSSQLHKSCNQQSYGLAYDISELPSLDSSPIGASSPKSTKTVSSHVHKPLVFTKPAVFNNPHLISQKKVGELSDTVKSKENEIQKLHEDLEYAQKNLTEAGDAFQTEEAEKEALKRTLTFVDPGEDKKWEERVTELENELSEKEEQLKSKDAQISESNGKLESNQTDLSTLKTEMKSKLQSIESTWTKELTQEKEKIQQKDDLLKEQEELLKTSTEALQKFKQFESKNKDLQRKLKSLETEHADALEEEKDRHTKVLRAEKDAHEAFARNVEENQRALIQEKTKALKEKLEELTKASEEREVSLTKTQADALASVELAKQKEATALSQMEEFRKEVETLKRDAQARIEGTTVQSTKILDLQKVIAKWKSTYETTKNKSAGYESELQKRNKDVKALQYTKNEKAGECKKLESEKKTLKQKLREWKGLNASLRKELESAGGPSQSEKLLLRENTTKIEKKWRDKLVTEKKRFEAKVKKVQQGYESSVEVDNSGKVYGILALVFFVLNILQFSKILSL